MSNKRVVQGTAIAKSGDKTVRIRVERKVLHPRYHKIVKRFKNYLVHDENNEVAVGDEVTAEECRPMSKTKKFTVKSFVKAEVI